MMYGYDMTGADWLWMVGGWIMVVVAVVGVAWLIARSMRSGTPSRSTPLEILQERFARGEINADEFDKGRQILR